MGRPWKIFVYYISIMLVFAGMVYIVPPDVTGFLRLASDDSQRKIDSAFFVTDTTDISRNTSFVDTLHHQADTLSKADTIKEEIKVDTIPEHKIPFLYLSNDTYKKIREFFRRLESARKEGKTVRVLHMGDSQIEGDRITRYIRESMQERYGGAGPGLFTVYDPQKLNPSVWLDNYGKWDIFRVYDQKNKLKDRSYGIMGTAAKFEPGTTSGFKFRPSPYAEPKAQKYYKIRLFLGDIEKPMFLKGYIGRSEIISDTLLKSKGITEINWQFEDNVPKLKLMFKSSSSPVFLGCALDSLAGVAVDNIALRGQYTPWFHRTNRDLFKTMVSYLDVGLIILQFGTNIIPTVSEDFMFYRIKMERQLRILKQLAPGCPVLMIGTADAARLLNGKEAPYENLTVVNAAQKAAALNSGAAFFDLYNAMGGKGTMIKWVHDKPPLAIKDYIHFTKPGGEKVAKMILKSLYEIADADVNDTIPAGIYRHTDQNDSLKVTEEKN
jgi:lysophospholipase L1-like esterase